MITSNNLLELAQQLLARELHLVTAESCTGGGIAAALTDLAGSSAWFDGGFVTYSNEMKQKLLGVKAQSLMEFGAVSETVVAEMAEGAINASGADLAVSVSGIAGPGGGSVEKPVGTVCFAVAMRGKPVSVSTQHFVGDRSQVRQLSVEFAIDLLREKLVISV